MQVAALAGKYLASDKADGKAVEKVLEGIDDPKERKKVLDEYEAHSGESFDQTKDKVFSGSEKDALSALEKGDKSGAKAAELRAASEHLTGTNKDEVFKVFENSPEDKAKLAALPAGSPERKQLEA